MKKFTAAILIILCMATMASAFGKKGLIPECGDVSYKGLRVSENGVSIILKNKSEKPLVFSAALVFVDKQHQDVGDTFIDKTTIPAGGEAALKDLYLKGDAKKCKSAVSLSWTIYSPESVN